ncbi:MAG TPA: hypothetical protein VMU08_04775 [Rhizomicrobium sp.]|nr:hypothetical protein [Rhizomicrobium sp.]
MTVRRLSRSYSGRRGAPRIHSVDTRIFALRYFTRCMACGFCNDQCCDHGVDIDVANAERLKALGEDFASRIAAPRGEWFTEAEVADAEFPGGRYVRTRTRSGKCVFRSAAGRGCAIHAYALEKGIDYHELKPLVSTLFPATFEHGVLVPSDEVIDGSLVCAGEGPSVYEGARGELAYYFGADFVAELDALARR